MSDDLVGCLKESKLFAGFSPEQLEEVVTHMNPKAVRLKSGERVFKKGDAADRAWLIQSGKLMIKRASLRSPFRHMILQKGSVTGIQGLVGPGTTRDVTMIADGKLKLVEITQEGISRLSADTQLLLYQNISKILLRKLMVCLSREALPEPDREVIQRELARARYPLERSGGDINAIRDRLMDLMWDDVGIIRSRAGLERGLAGIEESIFG